MFNNLDRRVRKTRQALVLGLAALMLEKDVTEISVKDLTDYVDINRSTFYAHFKDIPALLNYIEDELFNDFNKIITDGLTNTDDVKDAIYPTVLIVFEHLQKNKELASALIGPHGDLAFIHKLYHLMRTRITQWWPSENSEEAQEMNSFYSAFVFTGVVGIIKEWIRTDYKKTPTEMAKLSTELLIHGINK
ncbi:MAG: TetR/AcrR family transcriptional regulator [Lachnospiraceae bacterium]|nr:TetR/AcrR family transcriptional regulator [Lachnospiraceae bacterium]